jgi:hypothetical protein
MKTIKSFMAMAAAASFFLLSCKKDIKTTATEERVAELFSAQPGT